MFLSAVTLILQEILEASLLISVLQVLTTNVRLLGPGERALRNDWIYAALGWGLAGALVYGWMMPVTADWFDYAGYEVINAVLQAGMIGGLVLITAMLGPERATAQALRIARTSMIVVVAFGIVREGSEIILYLQGVMSQPENVAPALLGAVMAAGIGGSSGLLLYHLLCSLRLPLALRAALLLLALFAGNMAAQAVLLLTQADWLPYSAELWDSSGFLPEDTVTGHLLYALVGYEANPSLMQLLAYLTAVLLLVQSRLFRHAWFSRPGNPKGSTLR